MILLTSSFFREPAVDIRGWQAQRSGASPLSLQRKVEKVCMHSSWICCWYFSSGHLACSVRPRLCFQTSCAFRSLAIQVWYTAGLQITANHCKSELPFICKNTCKSLQIMICRPQIRSPFDALFIEVCKSSANHDLQLDLQHANHDLQSANHPKAASKWWDCFTKRAQMPPKIDKNWCPKTISYFYVFFTKQCPHRLPKVL